MSAIADPLTGRKSLFQMSRTCLNAAWSYTFGLLSGTTPRTGSVHELATFPPTTECEFSVANRSASTLNTSDADAAPGRIDPIK